MAMVDSSKILLSSHSPIVMKPSQVMGAVGRDSIVGVEFP